MRDSWVADGDLEVAVEPEQFGQEEGPEPGGSSRGVDDDYADYTSGIVRRQRERFVLWRGEDVLAQVSGSLGRQLNTIAVEIAGQLNNPAPGEYQVDNVELTFGIKIAADAGKALGIITVSAERAIQVKMTIKKSG